MRHQNLDQQNIRQDKERAGQKAIDYYQLIQTDLSIRYSQICQLQSQPHYTASKDIHTAGTHLQEETPKRYVETACGCKTNESEENSICHMIYINNPLLTRGSRALANFAR